MKKILVILILFGLTGCVSNKELVNTCTKVETANELTSTTIYVINFNKDIISTVNITNEYTADESTISALKLTTITQTNFWKDRVTFNTLLDNKTNYKVEYIIDVNSIDNDIYKYFNLQKERSKLVSSLRDTGFTCK